MHQRQLLKYFLLLALLVGFSAATDNSASACECEDLQERAPYLLDSDSIFLGKVKSIEKTNDKFTSYLVKFDVDKVWNGSNTKEIIIKASLDSGICGYPFAVNQTLVVHASKEDKILHEKGCGTLPVEYVTDYIRFLDENVQNIREDYVKYDFSKEEHFVLPAFIKKNSLPSDTAQSMQDWCANSSDSLKNDSQFWNAVPIRILLTTPEFQSLQGKTDSFVVNFHVAEESCPPNVWMVGTFASENGDRHRFSLFHDGDFFRYLIGEVQCKDGHVVVIKSADGSPACVTPKTKQILIERGWAKYNSHNAIYDKSDFDRIQIENRGMENQTCFGIYSNETRVSVACDMVTHGSPPIPSKPEAKIQCQGNKMCLTEVVTRIVDGDTIYITGGHKIRLSLTNTPEMYESGFYKATQFTENLCPVGSKVIVDQDDMQPYDAYDRLLGKVICDGKILNAELLYNGHANILTQYCKTSEFSKEKWAQEFGCQ